MKEERSAAASLAHPLLFYRQPLEEMCARWGADLLAMLKMRSRRRLGGSGEARRRELGVRALLG